MQKKKDRLHKKIRLQSAEAVGASILVHVLLILLAGSVVAVRYIQKRDTELNVVMTEPKLERRELQMPQTEERIRRTSRRPKILSSRSAAESSTFSVPDLGGIGELSTQKFDSPFARSGRDFRMLSKGVGVSAPDFRFLGIHGEGEAVIFILDASARMFSVESGGANACEYIKRELCEVLSELPASVLFNVLLCDGPTVAGFRSRMVPATEQNRLDLTNWILSFFNGKYDKGLPADENTYRTDTVYESAVGEEARDWARALQAAFEQRPDTVFLVSRDWGRHSISQAKWKRVVNSVLWFVLGISDGLSEDETAMRDDLIVRTAKTVFEEVEIRTANQSPVAFLRDLRFYSQYSRDQLLDHLDTICREVYEPFQLAVPTVHCVRLVSDAEDNVRSNPATQNLKKLADDFKGDFDFCNGIRAAKRIKGNKASGDGGELAAIEIPESTVRFFGKGVSGGRIAFVLDASLETVGSDPDGTSSFEFLKGQVLGAASALEPGTRFNVLVCDGPTLAQFRPEMIPASDAGGLAEWLSDLHVELDPAQGRTSASLVYATAIESDIQGVPLALQAAMEQRADLILAAGAGLGHLPVNSNKVSRILDFSIIEKLNQRVECENCGFITESKDPEVKQLTGFLASDRLQRDELLRVAAQRMKKGFSIQGRSRAPSDFFKDVLKYVEYLPVHIREHLFYVARSVYPEENGLVQVPEIYFAKLVRAGARVSRAERSDWREFQALFPGAVLPVQSANTPEEMVRLNQMLDLYPFPFTVRPAAGIKTQLPLK